MASFKSVIGTFSKCVLPYSLWGVISKNPILVFVSYIREVFLQNVKLVALEGTECVD